LLVHTFWAKDITVFFTPDETYPALNITLHNITIQGNFASILASPKQQFNLSLDSTTTLYSFITSYWQITNCTFRNIRAYDRFLIALADYNGKSIISGNRFLNNHAFYGGAILLAQMDYGNNVILEQNIFDSNTALQGGAIFFSVMNPVSLIAKNIFVNNTASLYGSTFAGSAQMLRLLKPQNGTFQVFSGDVFPTFGVFLQDVFFQTIVPSELLVDLLVADATVVGTVDNEVPEAAAIVGYQEVMLQGNNAAWFRSLQIVGSAGEYTLSILPSINFHPSLINASVNFTLKECTWPNTLQKFKHEPYPRCVQSEFGNSIFEMI
jgi:hypothetical protein